VTVYALLTEKQTFLDANSNELSGGKLFVYLAGTTTKATSYAETDGVSPNSNPIVLNSRGEVPNGLYVQGGATYKLVLAPSTDTDPPTSPIWTRDNLAAYNDISVTSSVSEWITSTFVVSFSNGTTFTVPGDVTDTYQTNRRVRATIGSGNIYGRIDSSTFALGVTTVVVTWDSGALDATLTAVDYALLSGATQSVPVPVNFLVRNTATIGSGANQTAFTAVTDTRTSSSSARPLLTYENTTADADAVTVSFLKSRTGLVTSNGDALARLEGYGRDSSNATRKATEYRMLQSAAAGASFVPGAHAWYVTNGSGTLDEALRVDSTGCVRVAGEAAAAGYTSRGDVTLPAARAVRAKNTVKAWVVFDGTGAGPTISPLASFNVTNITKNVTGDYTVNFTNALADINYCAVAMAGDPGSGNIRSASGPRGAAPTTSAFRFTVADGGPVLRDAPYIYVMVLGN
jgi:hypothetical protein